MKKTEEINQIIVELYDLILNKEVKERERVSLIEAKNKLEKQEYFPRVMKDLEYQLRPLAIKSQLTPPVAAFYLKISTIGRFEQELGRGLASTPIVFGPFFQ